MALLVNDKILEPAPIISINKSINYSQDGRALSQQFDIVLEGTILPNRGSPRTDGFVNEGSEVLPESFSTDVEKFNAITTKQELLRELLSTQGFQLKYYASGKPPVIAYPTLNSIQFNPSPNVIRSDYTINLSTDALNKTETTDLELSVELGASGLNLRSVADSFTIRQRPDGRGSYSSTRNVSATAFFQRSTGVSVEPWINAKTWVDNRLSTVTGLSNSYFSELVNSNPYNLVVEESIDQAGGSYSINQTFIYHTGNYIEEKTYSKSLQKPQSFNFGPDVWTLSVQGVISGLDLENDSDKITNARNYFYSITGLLASGIGASGIARSFNYTEDVNNGVINYNFNYINNVNSNYTFEYDVQYQENGANPELTINGVISGVSLTEDPQEKINYAVTGWYLESSSLKTTAFYYANGIYDINESDFTDYPVNKSVSNNIANGTVNFSYTYIYKGLNGGSIYTDEYSVSFETDNTRDVSDIGGVVRGNIRGIIRGTPDSNAPQDKYGAATSGWELIQSLLFVRVSGQLDQLATGIPSDFLRPNPVSRTLSLNIPAGNIEYSASFSSENSDAPTGVANLSLNIEDSNKSDVFAIQPIPGRALGPILQSIGTTTEQSRNINISMSMYPPDKGQRWGYVDKSIPKTISDNYYASGVVDLGGTGVRGVSTGYFVQADRENWDWRNGFYSRNITLVYNK